MIVASPRQVSTEGEGEALILDFEGGTYYGLDGVGARVWELIQQPRKLADVCDAIADEYGVERARCEDDVRELLSELADAGLIEVVDESSG